MEAMSPPLPKGRTLPIKGDAVRTFRLQRDWEEGELASRAGYSRKTIYSIENDPGKRVYAATLMAIAKALGVSHADLLAGPVGEYSPPEGRRISGVSIHFTLNFQNVDASDELISRMERLAAAIGATAEIEVFAVRGGSLVATVGMSEEDVLRLVHAFGTRLDAAPPPEGRAGGGGLRISPREGWKLNELGVHHLEFEPTPELLRGREAFALLGRGDFSARTYEESGLRLRNRKDIWYAFSLARILTALRLAPDSEALAERYRQVTEEAAGEGIEPDAEALFYAQLTLLCGRLSLLMSMPRIDRGGSLKIFHRGEATQRYGDAASFGPRPGTDPSGLE